MMITRGGWQTNQAVYVLQAALYIIRWAQPRRLGVHRLGPLLLTNPIIDHPRLPWGPLEPQNATYTDLLLVYRFMMRSST